MRAHPLKPIGALVSEVSVRALDRRQISWLRQQLAEHGVMIIRDQIVGDDDLVAFLRSFGEIRFTRGETPVPNCPDLNVITNVGRDRPPRSTFHVDTTYVPMPPSYTALRAVVVPEYGGQTLFSNQYRAHDTLPDEVRRTLTGRVITHVASGVDDDSSATHPVLRTHPVSGRTALYLTTPQRCASISGLTTAESTAMVRYLFEHSTAQENVLRHTWSAGDVVMWDNRVVMHRAEHAGVVGDRIMHRGMAMDAGVGASTNGAGRGSGRVR